MSFSNDGVTWYVDQAESTTTGVSTLLNHSYTFEGASAGTAYPIHFTFPVSSPLMRLSAKYTGTGAGTAGGGPVAGAVGSGALLVKWPGCGSGRAASVALWFSRRIVCSMDAS